MTQIVVLKLFQSQTTHIKKNQVGDQGLLHPHTAPGGLKEFYLFFKINLYVCIQFDLSKTHT